MIHQSDQSGIFLIVEWPFTPGKKKKRKKKKKKRNKKKKKRKKKELNKNIL